MNDGTIIIQDYNLHLSGSSFKQLVENDMNEWRQSLTIAVSFMIYDVAEQIQNGRSKGIQTSINCHL